MVEFANANHPRSDGRAWEASDILKNVVIAVMHPQDDEHDEPWRELVVVGVPGDRTVDMKRLEAQFTPAEIEEATDEDLKKHPELVKGYIGPMAVKRLKTPTKPAKRCVTSLTRISPAVPHGSPVPMKPESTTTISCTVVTSKPTAWWKPLRFATAT